MVTKYIVPTYVPFLSRATASPPVQPTTRWALRISSKKEALGSAASVIAVVQLAGRIIKICGSYIGTVKNAEKGHQQSVGAFTVVPEKLPDLLDCPDGGKLLALLVKLVSPISDCSLELEALKGKASRPWKERAGLGTSGRL
jgi:hypothetical protein